MKKIVTAVCKLCRRGKLYITKISEGSLDNRFLGPSPKEGVVRGQEFKALDKNVRTVDV